MTAEVRVQMRHPAPPEVVTPEALVQRHVENARLQLADGRENLKRARRRVVQLEEAVVSWERLLSELRSTNGPMGR